MLICKGQVECFYQIKSGLKSSGMSLKKNVGLQYYKYITIFFPELKIKSDDCDACDVRVCDGCESNDSDLTVKNSKDGYDDFFNT